MSLQTGPGARRCDLQGWALGPAPKLQLQQHYQHASKWTCLLTGIDKAWKGSCSGAACGLAQQAALENLQLTHLEKPVFAC